MWLAELAESPYSANIALQMAFSPDDGHTLSTYVETAPLIYNIFPFTLVVEFYNLQVPQLLSDLANISSRRNLIQAQTVLLQG